MWVCRIVHDKRCTYIFVIPGLNVKNTDILTLSQAAHEIYQFSKILIKLDRENVCRSRYKRVDIDIRPVSRDQKK